MAQIIPEHLSDAAKAELSYSPLQDIPFAEFFGRYMSPEMDITAAFMRDAAHNLRRIDTPYAETVAQNMETPEIVIAMSLVDLHQGDVKQYVLYRFAQPILRRHAEIRWGGWDAAKKFGYSKRVSFFNRIMYAITEFQQYIETWEFAPETPE